MRRMSGLLIAISLLVLAGCGETSTDGTTGGNPTNGGLSGPPGLVVNNGSGVVANQALANQRILNQFLGVRPRAVLAQSIGGAGAPLVNIYSVPGGARAAGVSVSPDDELSNAFVLDQPYYLYWVDPNPLAMLGHQSSILYLRASDGLLTEQVVDFYPRVGGESPLETISAQASNLIYAHRDWVALQASPGQGPQPQARVQPEAILGQIVGDPNGVQIRGLGVTGAPRQEFANGLELGRTTFQAMGGQSADYKTLIDTEADRVTRAELESALQDASLALGPDDKFFFLLTTHASKTGIFLLGQERLTWRELCELLEANVSAGNINVILDTCYSGQANAEFARCAPTSRKRMRVISTASGDSQAFVETSPTGTGYNLRLTLKKIEDAIAVVTSNNSPLLLFQLEQIFLDVQLTKAEIDKLVCDISIGDPPRSEELKLWKEDYDGDIGALDKIKGAKPGNSTGFDSRPVPDPNADVIEFIDEWGRVISLDDFAAAQALYEPGYRYNGQTIAAANGGGPGFDVDISGIDVRGVGAPDPAFGGALPVQVNFNRTVTTTTPGQPILRFVENHQAVIRVKAFVNPGNGQLPYFIISQQSVEKDVQGTFNGGLQPPPFPQSVDIGQVEVTGPSGLIAPGQTLNVGDSLTINAQIPNLFPIGAGGAAEVTFAGTLQPVTFLGGTNFSAGPFSVPNVPTGFYLIESYAENFVDVTSGMDFAVSSTANAKTIEVFINNNNP